MWKKKQKKKAKPSKAVRHTMVFLWKFFKHIQLREKFAKMQFWAENNKRQTAALTIGLLSVFLIVGILTSVLGTNHSDEDIMSGIEDVQPMFQAIQQIQDAKYNQKQQFSQLVKRGREIRMDLDSLLQIKSKTHQDSVRILVAYRQLEIIARNLKDVK